MAGLLGGALGLIGPGDWDRLGSGGALFAYRLIVRWSSWMSSSFSRELAMSRELLPWRFHSIMRSAASVVTRWVGIAPRRVRYVFGAFPVLRI
ncbi:MAG: hypothetical protein ACRCU1_03375 [Alsobacter sp.]